MENETDLYLDYSSVTWEDWSVISTATAMWLKFDSKNRRFYGTPTYSDSR